MSTPALPPQKQLTTMIGHPVAENPIDQMFDAVFAHYGLHWQFWKSDVATEAQVGAAIGGNAPWALPAPVSPYRGRSHRSRSWTRWTRT